jgi:hypothetical protein
MVYCLASHGVYLILYYVLIPNNSTSRILFTSIAKSVIWKDQFLYDSQKREPYNSGVPLEMSSFVIGPSTLKARDDVIKDFSIGFDLIQFLSNALH